ncbi:acyl-CoA/acyl-ACP dehydrogenase [Aldersonia sp. NBC_00410]|uniref:acyl-CoA dehydrogenase family protein n=1 Tax=Aldersonia sp. NBC_00410 TaxID=2975954 RepID=UPI002258B749|nr:acyl-CoA dehydrogenase family protein [Aldersonia sp. NBC_00410]MCX5043319.1 acyl-CoA/acyl-ACP dehydrogenase [Aldersonia sp. NBC_00410]
MTTPLTEEQRDLVESVRGLLAKHVDTASRRKAMESELGYDDTLWRMLCEQVGVAGLAIPERFGGLDAGLVEANLVLEELGRVLAPTPMFGSVVLGSQLLLATGDEEACARLLPDVAEGSRNLAVCWAGPDGWDAPGVTATEDGVLSGTASFVLEATNADVLLVIAHNPYANAVYEIDANADGVSRTAVPAMDPTLRLGEVSFADVRARQLGAADARAAIERLRAVAVTALAAEQVGAADACLQMTVEYTKSRVQFGRPIGSFQALKHRMADLYVLVEAARSASLTAAEAVANESGDAAKASATAKVYCSEAFGSVSAEAIQLHGGIAITWEHDAHLFFKRAHATGQLFGSAGSWVQRLEQAGLPE